MKQQQLQRPWLPLWLAVIFGSLNACQLVTGVNDLRVEDEPRGTTDDTDEPDADTSDQPDDDDETRSDDNEDAADDSDDSETTTEETSDESDSTQSESQTSDPTGADAGCEIPALLACAPITNCGCDEGTVCTVVEDDDNLTLTCQQPGTAELGEPCELGGCESGYHCWDGVCRQACARDADCEEEQASCEVFDTEGDILSKVRYCEAPCDLTAPHAPAGDLHACPDGQSCVRTRTSSVCSSAVGEGDVGAHCEQDANCAPGLGCVDGSCKTWCNPESAACGDFDACQALADGAYAGGPIGVCESTCQIQAIEGSTCGVLPDCGCSSGQSCRVAEQSGRTECSAIGAQGSQAECQADVDCQAGLSCVYGLCRPLCVLTAPACADGSTCFDFGLDADVGACAGSCDPTWKNLDDEKFTPCGDGALCQAGGLYVEQPTPLCVAVDEELVVDYGVACDPSNDVCALGSVCTGICEVLCRDHSYCEGATSTPECIAAPDAFLDADGSELGICCVPNHPESECSSFGVDCGCAEGEACRIDVDENGQYLTEGQTACFPAGDVQAQDVCSVDSDCARDSSCVDSLCRPHCGEACSADEGICIQVESSEQVAINGFRVCLGLCNPGNPSEVTEEWAGCAEGITCLPGVPDDPVISMSRCVIGSNQLDLGEECENHSECGLGMGCICDDPDCSGVARCQEWCLSDQDCDEGGSCISILAQINDAVPIGYCSE